MNNSLDIALRDSLLSQNLNKWNIEALKNAQKKMGQDEWARFLGGYQGSNFTMRIKNSFNKTVVEGWI